MARNRSSSRTGLWQRDRASPWAEIFSAFSRQIVERTGPALRDLLVCDFTTTGPVERAVSEVVLMGEMSSYFIYEVRGLARFAAGIRAVTLLDTPADWESVRRRAAGGWNRCSIFHRRPQL